MQTLLTIEDAIILSEYTGPPVVLPAKLLGWLNNEFPERLEPLLWRSTYLTKLQFAFVVKPDAKYSMRLILNLSAVMPEAHENVTLTLELNAKCSAPLYPQAHRSSAD